MAYQRLALLAVSAGLFALSPVAHAQISPAQIIEMGGVGQAVAEECKTHSSDELAKLKEEQRTNIAQLGVTPEEFDSVFASSYERTRGEIQGLSTEQKTEMCDQMKALNAAGPQG